MLQYPTNLNLDGQTFDPEIAAFNNKISFTFNGDFLTHVLYKVYDYNTGEQVKVSGSAYPSPSGYQDHRVLKYNGETFETAYGYLSSLTAGHDYALQLQLVQYTRDGSAPLCDMFVLRGLTQENYLTTDTYVTIEDNIANIYEWDTEMLYGLRHPSQIWGVNAGVMTIVIGNEKRYITTYNPETGVAEISAVFSNTIPAGTPYQIYANYKVSPLYFFKCRSVPFTTLELEINKDSDLTHHVSGTFSQAQNSLINYYTLALYYGTSPSNPDTWYKIDETEKIYSQNIDYKFYDDYLLRIITSGAQATYAIYYKVIATVYTSDGMTTTKESNIVRAYGSDVTCPTTSVELIITDLDRADTFYSDDPYTAPVRMPKQSIDIRVSTSASFPTGTFFQYYRENVRTGETVILDEDYDFFVPTKGTFKYYAVPRILVGNAETEQDDLMTYLKGIGVAEITTNMTGYTITELQLMPDSYQRGTRLRYKVGDQWKFVGEISDTTVTQNTDKYLHVGYGTYPSLTTTKTNYMTGTLTAMSGYVNCTTHKYVDNIDLIRAWREFITRPTIYMLKSQKGDVWIINVTDNPTTTYEEMQREIPTTFSFNWAECCSVDDIKILYHPTAN